MWKNNNIWTPTCLFSLFMKTFQFDDLSDSDMWVIIKTDTRSVNICSEFYTKLHILKLLLVWLLRREMLGWDFYDSSCKQNEVTCAGIQQSKKKKMRRTKKGHFVMTNFYNKMNLFKYNNLKSDHNQTNEKKTRHSLIFTNGLLHLTLSKELLCRCFLLTPARKGKPKH